MTVILSHGHSGYTRGCRCDTCRSVYREYKLRRRRAAGIGPRRPAQAHGTGGYRRGCRCDTCVSENGVYRRELAAGVRRRAAALAPPPPPPEPDPPKATPLFLHTASTWEGEEFHIIGRGDPLWTYSWAVAQQELGRRLTVQERTLLNSRTSPADLVRCV